jgi:hypothetical protein
VIKPLPAFAYGSNVSNLNSWTLSAPDLSLSTISNMDFRVSLDILMPYSLNMSCNSFTSKEPNHCVSFCLSYLNHQNQIY